MRAYLIVISYEPSRRYFRNNERYSSWSYFLSRWLLSIHGIYRAVFHFAFQFMTIYPCFDGCFNVIHFTWCWCQNMWDLQWFANSFLATKWFHQIISIWLKSVLQNGQFLSFLTRRFTFNVCTTGNLPSTHVEHF